MISILKFLDAYTLRARLFPAILALAPALGAATLLISWDKIALSNVIAAGAMLVLLFTLADFARKRGLALESAIYDELGGKPSITMFRYADAAIDGYAKEKYRQFLAYQINRPIPTSEEEEKDIAAGDSFYEQAGIWLRTNTRDTKKFPILWSELVYYGFRRNQLGLKVPGLVLNAIVAIGCSVLIWKRDQFGLQEITLDRIIVVLVIAVIHAIYFILVVDRGGVKEAARRYGRELIISTQTFIAPEKAPPARHRSKTPQKRSISTTS